MDAHRTRRLLRRVAQPRRWRRAATPSSSSAAATRPGQAAMFFANYARARDAPRARRHARSDDVALPYRADSLEDKHPRGTRRHGRARDRHAVTSNRSSRAMPMAGSSASGGDGLFMFIGADARDALAAAGTRARRARLPLDRPQTSRLGRRSAARSHSRPTSPASSPQATCAATRSSASRRASAKAAW